MHSPSTGIVDSHAFMLSLLGDLENAGGVLALMSPVARADWGGRRHHAGDRRTGPNCAAPAWSTRPVCGRRTWRAVSTGLAADVVPPAWYAKGNYFTLAGRAPFSRLIYPVPEAAGLGVHLTLDLGGQAKFGPDVQWVDSPDDLLVDPQRGDGFYAEVRKYWPRPAGRRAAAGLRRHPAQDLGPP